MGQVVRMRRTSALARWNVERKMLRENPVLAKLLRAEAISDHRWDNHHPDPQKLINTIDLFTRALKDHSQGHGAPATLRLLNQVLRRAVVEYTEAPFKNSLFV